MEVEDWADSSGGTSDSEVCVQDTNDEADYFTSSDILKLQFRKNVSRARWDDEMGMAEVVEKKGGMWTTTGIVRDSKIYCSIEETFGHPPSKPEIEDLERWCNGIPVKFCHVEHGRVSFFSFNKVELPILP